MVAAAEAQRRYQNRARNSGQRVAVSAAEREWASGLRDWSAERM